MKKTLGFLILCAILASCSPRMENKAHEQMYKTMRELAKNPESVKLSDIETVYVDDSICILHCKMCAQNGFGGYNSSKMEYILFKDYNKKDSTKAIYKEYLMNIDSNNDDKDKIEPAMELSKEIYYIFKTDKRSKLNQKQMKKQAIRVVVGCLTGTEGREIKNTSEKEDINKW